jgi:rare lipoprotein A
MSSVDHGSLIGYPSYNATQRSLVCFHRASVYLLMTKTTAIILLGLTLASCSKYVTQSGKASYYADKYNGRRTANGETFSNSQYVAAHKTLPFGTKVKVTNLKNGKTVKVRINDRGPFVTGRIIDLSKQAAKDIEMVADGVVAVKIKYRAKK